MTSWRTPVLNALGWLGLAGVLVLVFTERADAIPKLAVMATFLGMAALIMVKPHLGILLILAGWFTDFAPIGVQFLSIPYVVTACLLVPLGLALIQDRGIWVLSVPQVNILLAVALLFVAGTWWSWLVFPVTPIPGMDETARMLQLFVARFVFLILFLYFIRTPGRIEAVAWLMVALIAVAAADGFFAFQSGHVNRASASFGLARNSNRLGFICLFALSFVWFYRRYGPNRYLKALTFPLLFLFPLSAAATASRSAFLQMLILAGLMVKDRGSWGGSKRRSALVLLVAVAIAVTVVIPAASFMRATTYDPSLHVPGQESLQNRIRRVETALDVIVSSPILGVGIGNFRWVYRTFYGMGGESHNSYLWAATSGGLGTLALYGFLFYVTYLMLARLERSGTPRLLWVRKALRANFVVFLVFSAFADFWLSEYLYLILGMTIAMTYLDRRVSRGPLVHRRPLVHDGAVPRIAQA